MTPGLPDIRERALDVWGGRIKMRVKTVGQGAPLVYLHAASGLAFDPFLVKLSTQCTIYAPEMPGTSAGDPNAIHQGGQPVRFGADLRGNHFEVGFARANRFWTFLRRNARGGIGFRTSQRCLPRSCSALPSACGGRICRSQTG